MDLVNSCLRPNGQSLAITTLFSTTIRLASLQLQWSRINSKINEIDDARAYDGSSRTRRPNVGQIAVLKNANGFFAAVKIISIKDDTRGSQFRLNLVLIM